MSEEVQKSQEQQRQFVINVSHELKTPLTSIAGHAQALREGVAVSSEDVGRSLGVIQSEASRLSRLIEDLLSLARFDARQFGLKSATVPLQGILKAVADGFAPQAGKKGVELQTTSQPGLKATTDPDRLRQILSNLL